MQGSSGRTVEKIKKTRKDEYKKTDKSKPKNKKPQRKDRWEDSMDYE